nr:MAG TPA_asm: hypothetical protein [Caudoviricetes sp.]
MAKLSAMSWNGAEHVTKSSPLPLILIMAFTAVLGRDWTVMELVKNIAEFESLMWAELMDILGHDAKTIPPPVRRSWPTDGGPDWKLTDNVVFMQCTEAAEDIMQPIDERWQSEGRDFLRESASTRTIQLRLNAYGPACYESLLKLRLELLLGRPKLKKQKIYIIPGKDSIQYAPELFQGRWWKRADLTLYFNVLISVESIVKAIEEVNVTIKANEPGTSDVILEPGEIIIKKG